MNSILDRLVAAIPAAAASPLALVAYVLALTAWFVIALRVKRNRQVLSMLKLIPATERVQLLVTEMGAAPSPASIDVESWLRARRHAYYLIAFIVGCVTVIVVVAIALWKPAIAKVPATATDALGSREPSVVKQAQIVYMGSVGHADELKILPFIKTGTTRQFIEYHAGPPEFEGTAYSTEHGDVGIRVGYTFPKYFLVVVYDPGGSVVQYGVTLRDPSVRIPAPWRSMTIGKDTFAAFSESDSSAWYFNMTAHEFVYVERIWYAGDFQNRAGFVGYTDYGADMGWPEDAFPGSDILLKATDKEWNQLSSADIKALGHFRRTARPNTYGETTLNAPEINVQDVVVDEMLGRILAGQ